MRRELPVGDRTLGYLDSAASMPAPSNVALFLHAFPLNADMWKPQVDAAPPAWRFLALDLRGFGRADPGARQAAELTTGAGPNAPEAAPSIDDFADDALAFLDHLGVRKAVVVGLSMGGYAAFALLRRAPGRLAGLVLADTRAEADREEELAGRAQMLTLVDERGVSAVADQMIPRLLGDRTRANHPDIERWVRQMIESTSSRGVRDAIVRMAGRPDSTSLLEGISCPALVVVGDEDGLTPPDLARRMHQRIPGSHLVTLPGAAHLSNVEQPGRFNEAILAFLADRLEA